MYCHMGIGGQRLQPLREALALGDVPISQILPTHMARTKALIRDGDQWLQDGGWVDLTADDSVWALIAACMGAYPPMKVPSICL